MNTFVFPGQGAQFSGMGKSLYESCPQAAALMEKANEILGFRITDIMFNGSEEDLRATRVTQPAIFIHSTVLALCTPNLPTPDMTGGHSLGEFSALVAAGAMSFEDALRLVAIRAEAMQQCCEKVPGTMAAIIGMEDALVENICAGISGAGTGNTEGTKATAATETAAGTKATAATETTASAGSGTTEATASNGIVVAANYNSPGQIVISGETQAVLAACQKLKEAGAKRALPLAVGGAFHSPLMEPAALELGRAIDATPIKAPKCPIYQNVSAKGETDPAVIKSNLLKQLTSPVRWSESVRNMLSNGATSFLELGPGTVLQGLVKRISSTEGKEVEISGLS